jgi:dihydroorotase
MLEIDRDAEIQGDGLVEDTLPKGRGAHGHFRNDRLDPELPLEEQITPHVIRHVAREFASDVAEPNLADDPVTTGAKASAYRELLRAHAERVGCPDFEFHMTIKLTSRTTPDIVAEADEYDVKIIKVYMDGVTTNSEDGLKEFDSVRPALEEAGRRRMRVQLHGEHPDCEDWHLREPRFLDLWLPTLEWSARLPDPVQWSFEHVSTRRVVETLARYPNVGFGVTPQHLMMTWQDVVDAYGNLNGHCLCAPVIKDPEDRAYLLDAVFGRVPAVADRIWFAPDFAPHPWKKKEAKRWRWPEKHAPPGKDDRPPTGVYMADATLPALFALFRCYAGPHWRELLIRFIEGNPCAWYDWAPSGKTVRLVRDPWIVPGTYGAIRSLMAGRRLNWRIVE